MLGLLRLRGFQRFATAVALVGIWPGNPSRAETPPGSSFQNPPILEEIIVSATRRDAPAGSIPLSVSVLTGDTLELLGATGFADYARSVPGLSYTDGGTGGEKHTIRGISTNTWIDFNAVTALYFGEVPFTHASGGIGPPFTAHPMLVDIDRIEVLRGPQGTLFGSSAMGGALRILPNPAKPGHSEAQIGASAMSTEGGELGYGAHAVANLPLESLGGAVRVVGYLRDPGGYIDNRGNGQRNVNNREIVGARLSGAFLLSDAARLEARISYQDRHSDGLDREDLADERQQNHPLEEFISDEWLNYNLVLDVDLGWATLLSSTSYFDREKDIQPDLSYLIDLFFGFANPMWLENEEEVEELVQEFRLVSRDQGRFRWVTGVFYQDQDQFLGQRFVSPGFDELTGGLASRFAAPDVLEITRQQNRLEQLALYADMTYQLTDDFEISVGARWYDFQREFESEVMGVLFTRGGIEEESSADESGVNTKFSFSYTPEESVTVYGVAAEGFRSGGVNSSVGSSNPFCRENLEMIGLAGIPNSFDSDSLWNYELGLKGVWLGGRAQANTAVYHIDWSDMQTVRSLDCGVRFIENAGEATSDGLELEVYLRPLESIDINLAASYTRAELEEDVPNLGGREGDRIPGVPRYSANLRIRYHFPVVEGLAGFLQGEYQYVGKSFSDFDRDNSIELESFEIINLRLGVTAGQWSYSLFMNNLFDERGLVFAESGFPRDTVTATRPRMVGVSATRDF